MRIAPALAVLACAGAALSAGQPPTFRSGVELVAVDFLAMAKDGSAVRDLTHADVSLKVNGKPREIKSLQFVELARAADAGVIPNAPLPLPYGSNRLSDGGRSIVVVVDRDSIHPGHEEPIRAAIDHFFNQLTAYDRAGLVTLPRSPIEVGLTRDRARLHEALMKVSGQSAQTVTDTDKICKSRDMLFALESLLTSLAPIDGPKTVVVIASALLTPKQDFASFINRSTLVPIGTAPPERCDIKPDYFSAVANATALSRVHLYVVQSEVLRSDPGTSSVDYAGLESLAGVTGGALLPLLPGEEAFKRVNRESAGYYIATFEPQASERNGNTHKIDVKLARDNVVLRARPQFVIPRAKTAPSKQGAKEMLRDPAAFRDLPMHAVAYASREPDGGPRVRVIAVASPFDESAALTSASIGLVDSKDRLTAQWTATGDELKIRPLAAALTVAPGNYRLRVAAADATGRLGAADYEFEARLVDAGPVKLSTLAFGSIRDGQFAPALEFRDEASAVAYFEIYGAPRAGTLTALLEIFDAKGIGLSALPVRIIQTSAEDRRLATATIPLSDLPPGDYLVQATVATGRARATLRKTR